MTRLWKEFVPGGIEIHRVNGDHYTVVKKPNIDILAKKLGGALSNGIPEESARFASANL
jgi:hypothetical protein